MGGKNHHLNTPLSLTESQDDYLTTGTRERRGRSHPEMDKIDQKDGMEVLSEQSCFVQIEGENEKSYAVTEQEDFSYWYGR